MTKATCWTEYAVCCAPTGPVGICILQSAAKPLCAFARHALSTWWSPTCGCLAWMAQHCWATFGTDTQVRRGSSSLDMRIRPSRPAQFPWHTAFSPSHAVRLNFNRRSSDGRVCAQQDILCTPEVRRIVGTVGELPSLSSTYIGLRQAVSDPSTSISQVAEIIGNYILDCMVGGALKQSDRKSVG